MKTTLLATTGLSPAIVTETIWALAQQDPPIIPNEVEIITTQTGRETCDEALHTPLPSWGGKTVWETLRERIEAKDDELIFKAIQVISLPDSKKGRSIELDDIQTPEENAACAEFIFSRVWNVVRDKDQRLISSIAGGRKTMGALLHSAVSLIGRETDLLTHILVNPPFDTMRGFFFPEQPGGELEDFSKQKHNPIDAVPKLAEVPFVPLRNRFKNLDDLPGSFLALKNELSSRLHQDASRKVPLIINHQTGCLTVDGKEFKMPDKALILLHFVLKCNEKSQIPPDNTTAADAFNAWFPTNRIKMVPIQFTNTTNQPDFTDKDVRSHLSEIRKILNQQAWHPALRTLEQAPFTLKIIPKS